jgi:hypothetical protein
MYLRGASAGVLKAAFLPCQEESEVEAWSAETYYSTLFYVTTVCLAHL